MSRLKEIALSFAFGLLWLASVLSLVTAGILVHEQHPVIGVIVAAPVVLYGIYYIGETLRP